MFNQTTTTVGDLFHLLANCFLQVAGFVTVAFLLCLAPLGRSNPAGQSLTFT